MKLNKRELDALRAAAEAKGPMTVEEFPKGVGELTVDGLYCMGLLGIANPQCQGNYAYYITNSGRAALEEAGQ